MLKNTTSSVTLLSYEEIHNIKYETREQVSNEKWHYYRRDTITASMAGEIIHRRDGTPPDALVKRICYPSSIHTSSIQACQHGRNMEAEARDAYMSIQASMGSNVNIEERGLVIDEERFWLGASVNGDVTAANKEVGLLEIKSPFVNADEIHNVPTSLRELMESRKNVLHLKDCNGDGITLDENHNYYYQVEVQLGIVKLPSCDFMVYYKVQGTNICDIYVIHIPFNRDLFENVIIPKLEQFYIKGVAAEILARRVGKDCSCTHIQSNISIGKSTLRIAFTT